MEKNCTLQISLNADCLHPPQPQLLPPPSLTSADSAQAPPQPAAPSLLPALPASFLFFSQTFGALSDTSLSLHFLFPPSSSSRSSGTASAIAAGDRTTSSVLSPTSDSPFFTISPTSHTATPHPIISLSNFIITCHDCSNRHICSGESSRSYISRSTFTSSSAKIRLLTDFVPIKDESNGSCPTSGTESIAESSTSYAHTTPPCSTARRATTYPSSVCSARGYSSSSSDSGMCRPYTPAASGTTIRSRLLKSSIAPAGAYDAATITEAFDG
ncbi:uncharacterized protein MONOS_3842 [Monocercomonoides exilis]|uniref:uncharacterized protein n=1 Tax=Monocercomonoides exilis TaxID=2049356 RepID=UPI00355AA7D0|nr:hypothetical protein MONOS_3842 [Monocercomonoides exilis]|eukprot:MONOS_3842.1-p1 / transcript=MONOS_3842.1 / gene=MONOS_3842 / organism=Monocercomonoides_exilis_PA203 / gene_product=unspecified product / transcript_product=unspecified product / location=Mono_scaffold00094:123167-123979(-) / protein_length=271 / sequence_SO=supercontig / SO=protein_coding / is_pseudo=false